MNNHELVETLRPLVTLLRRTEEIPLMELLANLIGDIPLDKDSEVFSSATFLNVIDAKTLYQALIWETKWTYSLHLGPAYWARVADEAYELAFPKEVSL
jgi:hypothetical protein